MMRTAGGRGGRGVWALVRSVLSGRELGACAAPAAPQGVNPGHRAVCTALHRTYNGSVRRSFAQSGFVRVGLFECARGQCSTRRLVGEGYDQQRAGDREAT